MKTASFSWSIVPLLLAVAACSSQPEDAPPPPVASPGVSPTPAPSDPPATHPEPAAPPGIHALRSIDATDDDADLRPFDAVVGATEMIGLGESIHASGGYHRVRTRLVRHMVEKLGFRAVALETPWGWAEAARRYVDSCEGSPTDAARSIFGVFASVQMRDLFAWMCGWNQTHPTDKVVFFGFDTQIVSYLGARLRDFSGRVAPERASLVKALDACVEVKFDTVSESYADPDTLAKLTGKTLISDKELAACESAVAAAKAWLTTDQASLVAKSGPNEVELAKLAVDGIDTNEHQLYWLYRPGLDSYKKGYEARDVGMAKTLVRLRALQSPGKRVAVIAHNAHLGHAFGQVDFRSMGQVLKEDHRASFEAIGLVARTVHVNWDGVDDPAVADAPGDVEQLLYGFQQPALFVDLDRAAAISPGKEYGLGGDRIVPRQQFRALVYLHESEKMTYGR